MQDVYKRQENNIDLDEIKADDSWIEKRDLEQAEIRSSTLSTISWEYMEMSRAWLNNSDVYKRQVLDCFGRYSYHWIQCVSGG